MGFAGKSGYDKLSIPKGKKSISLFVETADGTKLQTDQTCSANAKFLVRLSLDHLGMVNRALHALGYLTTLYVSFASQASPTK
jgi:hypothetical protein